VTYFFIATFYSEILFILYIITHSHSSYFYSQDTIRIYIDTFKKADITGIKETDWAIRLTSNRQVDQAGP
jgi:hypothetical protein